MQVWQKRHIFVKYWNYRTLIFFGLFPEYDILRNSPNSYFCFLCFWLNKIPWADNTALNQNHLKWLIKLHVSTNMTNLSLPYHQIIFFLFMIVIKTMMKLRYLTKYMNLYFKFTIEFWAAVGLFLLLLQLLIFRKIFNLF